STREFIQHDYLSASIQGDQSLRQSEPLLLTLRERDAALSNARFILQRHAADVVVYAGRFRGIHCFAQRGFRASEANDIGHARPGKEDTAVLRNMREQAAQLFERPLADVAAADLYRAALHIEHAREHVLDGGFAAA